MGWVRIDDAFYDHPKMASAGPLGWALWLAGLAYCNRNLTDGVIPWSTARRLVEWTFLGSDTGNDRGRKIYSVAITCGMAGDDVSSDFVIDLLLDAGLWEMTKDGNYYIHDYPDYQPLKEEVLAQRAQAAERQARSRSRRDSRRESPDSHGVSSDAPTPTPKEELNTLSQSPNGTATGADAPSQRVSDELFESIVEVCYAKPYTELTDSERGRVNKARKELAAVKATPADVRLRAGHYRARSPTYDLTPQTLCKSWTSLTTAQPRGSPRERRKRLVPAADGTMTSEYYYPDEVR